ncbi:hypothetical protein BZG36_02570 [Bifiguratus adelaidae]|uniref:DNA topoisomerase 2 n=1 Tax=Bifiguratus adelaidae TaxID=1938954 RepID=A0A261Y0Z0_9FUNG|nr:hypothetical protein BZG36_02570 [Bifiguratus adelaidae]
MAAWDVSEDSGDDYEYGSDAPIAKPKTIKSTAKSGVSSKTKAAKPTKKPLEESAVVNMDDAEDGFSPGPAVPASTMVPKTIEETYQKKSLLEHIILRPDSYIGSKELIEQEHWVFNSETNAMEVRKITIAPGLYKIVDEILVNAADNKARDESMNELRVSIDPENNVISVYNNGKGIPIEIHKEEKIYVPELIFGHLLTGSNYDDSEEKVTGGRNGYGAKLCNIFSTEFIVETADKERNKKYEQVFQKNMSIKKAPKITANSRNKEYTKITFRPDLEKFGMTIMDADFVSLIKKRVYDMAGCLGEKKVKVFLNDEQIKIRSFEDYCKMYLSQSDSPDPQPIFVKQISPRWKVGFALSEGQFRHVSFVNSIATTKGGTHIKHIQDSLVKIIQPKVNTKGVNIKPFQIKNQLSIFVNCQIPNPTFDSQTKENMTLKPSAFSASCLINDELFDKINSKIHIVDRVKGIGRQNQDKELKTTDGSKRNRIAGIPKLEDANWAGTRRSHECTLILTEGDSAKATAVSGMGVAGRDRFGVFPLRGKLLNVREANHESIMKNTEISNIKKILGLQHNKEYTTLDGLRYGALMIMTDQDHDGSHIKGLLINYFDKFYPSLLKVAGFLVEFITPIVKCTKGNQEISFFTIPEYEAWKLNNNGGKGWKFKYYKGLGTSTAQDAKKYFNNLQLHRKEFHTLEDGDRDLIDMAFSKKKADERKEWLRSVTPGTFIDHSASKIRISDFINKELILFSVADNMRSIPSMVDGLKPGQRKVMWSAFKKKIADEVKVAQLVGYVSEQSAYHHGEASLTSTIVGLAQDFVGSNNINLLSPIGQFGTRAEGGNDAASARYIFTGIPSITKTIFHPDDDKLLHYLDEDGDMIEPHWYIPILPMILVNGSEGIGTGWSSKIPNYNPMDIVDNLKRLMNDEEPRKMHPWFRGFQGDIEEAGENKYKVTGKATIDEEDCTIEITELPVRTWTLPYKEFLEGQYESNDKEKAGGFVKDIREYHTESTVNFKIKATQKGIKEIKEQGIEKKLRLVSTLSTSNMVCFDAEARIRKYNSVDEILKEFYGIRLEYYQRRKQYLLNKLKEDFTRMDNKVRFLLMVISGELKVQNRKRQDIIADLKAKGFTSFPPERSGRKISEANQAGEDADDDSAGYNYLLSMPIWNLTLEKVEKLKVERAQVEADLNETARTTPKQMWNKDLDAFVEEWEAILQRDEDYRNNVKVIPRGKKTAKSAPKTKAKAAPKSLTADMKTEIVPVNSNTLSMAQESMGKAVIPSLAAKSKASGLIEKPLTNFFQRDSQPIKLEKSAFADSDDEDQFIPLSKSTQPKLEIGTPDRSRSETPVEAQVKPKPAPKKRTIVAAPRRNRKQLSDYESEDDLDDIAPARKVSKSSESDDVSASPRPTKRAARTIKKVSAYIELSENEEDASMMQDDDSEFEEE